MTIYAIRPVCELSAAKLGQRVICLTDEEALDLAQKIANAGLTLQVWRGGDLIGTVIAVQDAQTDPVRG